MNVEELKHDASGLSPWQRHRFLVLIASVILIAVFMVSVALSLYNSSGASLLDLSRPGYQSVRDQAVDTPATSYPSTGVLNKAALDQFDTMYNDRTSKVISVDSFDAAALSEKSLQLLSTTKADSTVPSQ